MIIMALRDIILHPDPKLKKVCNPIAGITDDIRLLVKEMLETMYGAPGIGLAAPQVGVLKRVFVMDCTDNKEEFEPLILINPEIVWSSKEKNIYEEGCLSIPDFFGEIERPSAVTVTSHDLEGNLKSYDFEGLWATCAQHEIDHLNGKLFIDYLGPMRRSLITSKMRKIKKEKMRKIESEK